jgi:two-component system, NarL family, sensor kinase
MSARAEATPIRPVSIGALLLRFTVAGLLVMAVVSLVMAFLARQAANEQAVDSARDIAWVTARGIVEPRLEPGVVAGDPEALTRFDAAMRRYVLQGSLIRVKVWSADGRIIYSDESRQIGQTFPLGHEEEEALRKQTADSEISDLSRSENELERSYGKLLEVYVGVRNEQGVPMLFEAYFRYDAVVDAGQDQWRNYAPTMLGGLLVLQLVQIPFAWSLARRLQRQEQERQVLLQHAVEASDAERRRIAADLHDGVVQDLTGLAFALDAARLAGPDPPRDQALIRETASRLRHTAGQLRSLLVDIYPPDLAEEGLPAALAELTGGLTRSGVEVQLDVDSTADLPLPVAAVLFRSAQEALRNVASHSQAKHVHIRTCIEGEHVRLTVEDDGRGFDEELVSERQAAGHVGLRSLGDLIGRAGGQLTIRSAPGQGTRIDVVIPLT